MVVPDLLRECPTHRFPSGRLVRAPAQLEISEVAGARTPRMSAGRRARWSASRCSSSRVARSARN
ncbi:hypothetical protein SBD_3737 [Streptomyces bottropensis ATCC 25435]|uniref:Uncharacterized protein n=1 Tax=Streptomyces bottropensis ATCC 25435 TaxID=1054862 RepID=M3FPM1_9ACTN|nr:hypothetical protein SBD_3737 [Streptomyces bottropensis ATCC 25435]